MVFGKLGLAIDGWQSTIDGESAIRSLIPGMATHGADLLGNYEVILESRGPLDLYELDAIREIRCILPEDPTCGAEVEIVTVWPRAGSEPVALILRFTGVRDLELPRIGGQWFGFSELEVQDIAANGLEGLRLQVVDYGEGGLRFVCGAGAFVRLGERVL